MSLVIHPTSEKVLAAYLQDPPHALLLTGPYGVGASSIAQQSAKQLSKNIITVLPEKDDAIDTVKGTITVALIRRLYEQTRTAIDNRVIVIDYVERMAATAQNAFLKLLEEPTTGTTFILVSHEPSKLLPTVISRVGRLDIQPITQQQSLQLLDALGVTDQTKRTQLLYMAAGRPAKLHKLTLDESYFEKTAQIVRDAKQFLQNSEYDKLLVAQKYKDDRPGSLQLLEIAMVMVKQSLATNPQPTTIKKLDELLKTYESVQANGNIRLQLARAVL